MGIATRFSSGHEHVGKKLGVRPVSQVGALRSNLEMKNTEENGSWDLVRCFRQPKPVQRATWGLSIHSLLEELCPLKYNSDLSPSSSSLGFCKKLSCRKNPSVSKDGNPRSQGEALSTENQVI